MQVNSPLWMEARRLCVAKHKVLAPPCPDCKGVILQKHEEELAEIAYGYDEGE